MFHLDGEAFVVSRFDAVIQRGRPQTHRFIKSFSKPDAKAAVSDQL